jgi:HD-GYP domain-containing protein (c-di-GMP phosphodiesterase class II)
MVDHCEQDAASATTRRRKIPLYAYIGSLFLCLMLLATGIVIAVEYRQTRHIALSDASTLFEHIGEKTRSIVELGYDRAMLAADLIASDRLAEADSLEERLKSLPFLLATLRGDGDLSAVYVGYANGEIFMLRRIGPRLTFAADVERPEGSAFVVQSRARTASGAFHGELRFYGPDGGFLGRAPAPEYDRYDPRIRPWYLAAQEGPGVRSVPPYVFYSTREIGASFVRRSADGSMVSAVDVTLGALSSALARMRPSPAANLTIMNGNGEIVADAAGIPPVIVDAAGAAHLPTIGDEKRPVLAALARQALGGQTGTGTLAVDGEDWQSYVSEFDLSGEPLFFAMAVPQAELLAPSRQARNFGLEIALLTVVPLVPLVMSVSQIASRPLRALTREAELIRRLKFEPTPRKRSPIAEIDTLAETVAGMKATIRQFIEIGFALSQERHVDRLLQRILAETAHVAGARGGAVYLAEPDGSLSGAVAAFESVVLDPTDLDPVAEADHPAMRAAAGQTVKMLVGPDRLARWYPGVEHTTPLLALSVPLRDRLGELAGVLVLLQEAGSLEGAEEADVVALVEAVSGIAAVTIEAQRLIEEQKQLIAAVIELIAGAIDAKSPYTGKHCQRVPEIARMLAAKAIEAQDGPFAGFSLTESQWEELHLAAWMHDCGKLLTPEWVVDKATKLETIYDRLHEVRMRFEVIKREAEAVCWKAIADGADRERCLAELDQTWKLLDEEFAFVASCNVGGERLGAGSIARLRQIGERHWTRTLDDRIGLSYEERRRKEEQVSPPLPAAEKLLADRPDHVIERSARDRIAPDNPYGFDMEVPEHLYDRGELYNLSIERGTLTPEERFQINVHVVDTIRMLGRLPLPRHLRNAVEIAGGHHEKIDGTGYPRRLVGSEMSVPARIMAIADIFEALTAADRPYKRPLRLSEAVAIMARMRDEGHIDRDVFALFLSAGVYRDYAERFLGPDQIDPVDVERHLRGDSEA